jgi:hypothetical protein
VHTHSVATARIVLPEWLGVTPTAFAFTVALSGQIYRVRLLWNPRANENAGCWMVDLRAKNGTAIVLGVRLLLTDDLWGLWRYDTRIPPGALRVRRTDGGTSDPGAADLAGAVALEYVI